MDEIQSWRILLEVETESAGREGVEEIYGAPQLTAAEEWGLPTLSGSKTVEGSSATSA